MAKQQPIELRIGAIKAAIWENETQNGARHNVKFSRLYHDGESWQSSESFGRDDLLALAKLADLTHTRIFSIQREREGE